MLRDKSTPDKAGSRTVRFGKTPCKPAMALPGRSAQCVAITHGSDTDEHATTQAP